MSLWPCRFKHLFKHHRARLRRSSNVPFSLRQIVHFMFMEFQWKFNWVFLLSRFGSSLCCRSRTEMDYWQFLPPILFFPLPVWQNIRFLRFPDFFFIERFITVVLVNCQFFIVGPFVESRSFGVDVCTGNGRQIR